MSSGSKALVIGYGNTLRRDDGVGPFVAGLLKPSPGLHVITRHQLTPELAEPVSQADLVIFVDARADRTAGEIVMERVPPRDSTLIHQLGPGALLQWSLKLYGRTPEAILIGIGGESFDPMADSGSAGSHRPGQRGDRLALRRQQDGPGSAIQPNFPPLLSHNRLKAVPLRGRQLQVHANSIGP